MEIEWGDDFGGDEETVLASLYDRPVMITHYPAAIEGVLHAARPGGPEARPRRRRASRRRATARSSAAASASTTTTCCCERIQEHELPVEAFQWYLDVRKYGTFPHSGFGMGIERFVAWMCGVPHLRETIPYPRMLYKIYP